MSLIKNSASFKENKFKKTIFSYALLSFPLAFIGLPIYIYLPDFYNQNFNISLQEVAVILFFSRFFDATLDPAIGVISDKFANFRKRIILISSLILGLSVIFLFSPLNFLPIKISLIISLIFTYTVFSIIWINHQSIAVSLSQDYNQKTQIIAKRESFFICGIIFASILPSLLQRFFSEITSFKIIGFSYFFLISAIAWYFFKFCQIPNQIQKNQSQGGFKEIFKEKKLLKFFSIFFFNSIASSIPASLISFYVAKVLNLENYLGAFLITYFVGLIIGIFFWSKLSQRNNNKVKTWLISSIFVTAVFPFCYFLQEGDLIFYLLICLLSGFGFGSDFCINYSILTDIIQEKKLQKLESTIFAFTNFLIKISFTVVSAALIYALGAVRDTGNLSEEKIYLSVSYALFPLLFKLISLGLLVRFKKQIQ